MSSTDSKITSARLELDFDFQLQRLVLIDSYSPDRIVELPLSAGTVLTGRNGSGKTSLLQLIPLFFGEAPSNIVRSEAGKLNFLGYYLPRITSYIIFEYRRRDVMCMVVLSRGADNESVRYRFIRSPYLREFFIFPDGRRILPAGDLRSHVRSRNVNCTEQFTISEYRKIIQGRAGTGREDQKLRGYVADYSYVGPGQRLQHIEKIISGMFRRSTNFADLLQMVVSCIDDERSRYELGAERAKFETWPKHYDAYRTVMLEAPRMAQVDEYDAKVHASEEELGRVRARMEVVLTHRSRERDDAIARSQELESIKAAQADAFGTQNRELGERKQQAELEARNDEGAVQRLDQAHANYERQRIIAQATLLERESEIKRERDQLGQRHDVLLGEQQNVSSRYDRLINEDVAHLQSFIAQAQSQIDEVKAGFEPRLDAAGAEHRQKLGELRTDFDLRQQALQESLNTLSGRVGEFRTLMKNPLASAEALDRHQDKLQGVEGARRLLEQSQTDLRTAEDELRSERQRYESAERALTQAQEQVRSIQTRRDDLLRKRNPSPESLLSFLREQRADWSTDIAKVIREDLLLRTDLAPALIDAVPSLYGVEINLDALESALAADEVALQVKLDEISTLLQNANEHAVKAEKDLTSANQARKVADRKVELQRLAFNRAVNERQSAMDAERAARLQVEHSREAARREAQAAYNAATEEAQALRQALQDLRGNQAKAEATLEAEREQSEGAIRRERDAEVQRVHAQIAERRAQQEQRQSELERERQAVLHSAGVDTEALAALKQQIEQTDATLRDIDDNRDSVAQWKLWLKNDWSRRDGLVAQAKAARDRASGLEAKIQSLISAWRQRTRELDTQLKSLSEKRQAADGDIAILTTRIQLLAHVQPDAEVLASPFDPAWTIDSLIKRANAVDSGMRESLKDLKTVLEAVRKPFFAFRDTPPGAYYEQQRLELGPDARERAWVTPLRHWFNEEHHKIRRILNVEAQALAASIRSFQTEMEQFHRKVLQFNRELQENLDANLAFERISRISIEIVSEIRELGYWPAIEQLVSVQDAWSNAEGELPPPEFAQALTGLLQKWTVSQGISANLHELISLRGEVVENDVVRAFKNGKQLEAISSNGLSYLVLCVIFVAFINRIRRAAKIQVVWSLDELRDLDIPNVEVLLNMLDRNRITLVSAFPDPDPNVLAMFPHRRTVESGRRLVQVELDEFDIDAVQVVQDAPREQEGQTEMNTSQPVTSQEVSGV